MYMHEGKFGFQAVIYMIHGYIFLGNIWCCIPRFSSVIKLLSSSSSKQAVVRLVVFNVCMYFRASISSRPAPQAFSRSPACFFPSGVLTRRGELHSQPSRLHTRGNEGSSDGLSDCAYRPPREEPVERVGRPFRTDWRQAMQLGSAANSGSPSRAMAVKQCPRCYPRRFGTKYPVPN